MESIRELFEKDTSRLISLDKTLRFSHRNFSGSILGRLLLDFESGIKYPVIFLDKNIPQEVQAIKYLIDSLEVILNFKGIDTVNLSLKGSLEYVKYSFENPGDGSVIIKYLDLGELNMLHTELVYSNRFIIYKNGEYGLKLKKELIDYGKSKGVNIIIRDGNYMKQRKKLEKPIAFISHASADKEIAKEIAIQMRSFGNVWYDEFSLKVGDSLKDSIEKGIKESNKCILLLTKNFLNKGGWTKLEYDSIFTREMIEEKRLILPVWHDIEPKDVYKYSPILADRVAVNWKLGVKEVCRKLLESIELN